MRAKQYGWKEYCGVKTIDNIPDSIAKQSLIDAKVLDELVNRYYGDSNQELETLEREEEKEDKKLMFCPYCGKQILRTVKFCNFCGRQNNYNK